MAQAETCFKPLIGLGTTILSQQELDPQRPGVEERERDFEGARRAAIGEALRLHVLEHVERAHLHHVDPVRQRGVEIAHHVAVLPDLTEEAAHIAACMPPFQRRGGV